MSRRFPHLDDNYFPGLENVNPYQQSNVWFDYNTWLPNCKLTVCSVAWDNERHAVAWETLDEKVEFFDNLESYRVVLDTMVNRQLDGSIRLPIPFATLQRYNYIWVEFPPQPVEGENSETRVKYYGFFITHTQQIAPSTVECVLELDYWTTFSHLVSFTYCELEQGHAPMAAIDVDTYLADPASNCEMLLTSDVNYGDTGTDKAVHSEWVPFAEGDPVFVFVTSLSVTDFSELGEVDYSQQGSTPPTYYDVDERWGHQYGVNGYQWYPAGYYGDADLPVTHPGFDGSVPTQSRAYMLSLDKVAEFFETVTSKTPWFMSSILASFIVPIDMVTVEEEFDWQGFTLSQLGAGSQNIGDVELSFSKEDFNYPEQYAGIAKLYTYPYAYIELSDNDGKTVQLRVEATTSELTAHRRASVVWPWLKAQVFLTGINGVGGTSYEFKQLTGDTSSETAWNTPWSEYLLEYEIPTYGVFMQGYYEWLSQNAYTVGAYERLNAKLTYENTMRTANTDYENECDREQATLDNRGEQIGTVYTNAVNTSTTVRDNSNRSSSTDKTNADNFTNTDYTNAVNQATTLRDNTIRTSDMEETNSNATSSTNRTNTNNTASTVQTNDNQTAYTNETNQDNNANLQYNNTNESCQASINYGNDQHGNLTTYRETVSDNQTSIFNNGVTQQTNEVTRQNELMQLTAEYENQQSVMSAVVGAGAGVASLVSGDIAGAIGNLGNGVNTIVGVFQNTSLSETARNNNTMNLLGVNTTGRAQLMATIDSQEAEDRRQRQNKLDYDTRYNYSGTGAEMLNASRTRSTMMTNADNTRSTEVANAARTYNMEVTNATNTYNTEVANAGRKNTAETNNANDQYSTSTGNAARQRTTELNAHTETYDTEVENASASYTTQTGNAARTQSTDTSVADRDYEVETSNAFETREAKELNAKNILENRQTLAAYTVQQKKTLAPVQKGSFTGDAGPDLMRYRGCQIRVFTQNDNAVRQAGDYFLRYGYRFDGVWQVDSLRVMPFYSYWKMAELWIDAATSVVQDAKTSIQRMFQSGVTMWNNPLEIGKVSIYDNQ